MEVADPATSSNTYSVIILSFIHIENVGGVFKLCFVHNLSKPKQLYRYIFNVF